MPCGHVKIPPRKAHDYMSMTRRIALLNPSRWSANRNTVTNRQQTGLLGLILPLARPRIAGLVALAIYLLRGIFSYVPLHGGLSVNGLQRTDVAYFNYLADAFLHGQLNLRSIPPYTYDLVVYHGKLFPYWPPFPALLITPLVFLFGTSVSDVLYTAVLAAISIALLAKLLQILDEKKIAPLTTERRAILVATLAFGSVLFILAPIGRVWSTGQIVGWLCVLLATNIALTRADKRGYFLVGVALACAATSRTGMLFNGVWLAYYMFRRDRSQTFSALVSRVACGLVPIAGALLAQGWYNWTRFGNPLDMGLAWHNVNSYFRADFERYGVFNLHYLPINLYYQFVGYTLLTTKMWMGGGIFWMTPVLIGAPVALWLYRHSLLTWALLASCVLTYIPIGLCMGTGFFTFGPRYLLDLMVPMVVLTALGIRRWRLDILQVLMIVSCATYLIGSVLWLLFDP